METADGHPPMPQALTATACAAASALEELRKEEKPQLGARNSR